VVVFPGKAWKGETNVELLKTQHEIVHMDCLKYMKKQPAKRFNLIFGSPPYEDKRTYGTGFRLRGEAFVEWFIEIAKESIRVCDGLVAFVIDDRLHDGKSSCVVSKIEADMDRAGYIVRPDNIYYRSGVPGARRDTFRRDHERIICFSAERTLPFCEITADGWAPICRPGGPTSNRDKNGQRANQGETPRAFTNPLQVNPGTVSLPEWGPIPDWATQEIPAQPAPLPDWVDDGEGSVTRCSVGGGKMGHPLAHKGQAPFPLRLAARYVRTFCPKGGWVYDPFCDSGTTTHAATLLSRNSVTTDIREEACDLARERLADVRRQMEEACTKKS